MLMRVFRSLAGFVNRILDAHLPMSVWLDASTLNAYRTRY
jgi:hypothetical protein